MLLFRVLSLNVRGISNDQKRRKIYELYRRRCDVFLIQEAHCTRETEHMWKNEWGGANSIFAWYKYGKRGHDII